MSRTRAWRRHQEERIISKRLRMLKEWECNWDFDHEFRVRTSSYEWALPIKHMLSKYNLVCSCVMCRDEKWRNTKRHILKQQLYNELIISN